MDDNTNHLHDEKNNDHMEMEIMRSISSIRQYIYLYNYIPGQSSRLNNIFQNIRLLDNNTNNICICGNCNLESKEEILYNCIPLDIQFLDDNELEDNCGLCLDCFSSDLEHLLINNDNDYLCKYYKINKCNHIFHKKCFEDFIKFNIDNNKKTKCPMCRTSIIWLYQS